MLGKAYELYKRVNTFGRPEHSLLLRMVIMLTVLTGALGIIAQGYFSFALNAFVVLGLMAGYLLSYLKRESQNMAIKILLTISLFFLMAMYLYDVANTFFDPRIPLAKLFLLLQVMHSFDLPRRHDLEFSLYFSLITISLGAVIASDMSYLIFVALYVLFYLPSMILLYVSELRIKVEEFIASLAPRTMGSMLAYVAAATLVVATALFFLLPRYPVQSKYTYPFKAPFQVNLANAVSFSNPLYQTGATGATPGCDPAVDPTCASQAYDWKKPPSVNPDSYYGLNSFMDLRTRGKLSENIVMRVKTIYPTFYRGVIFDSYNGLGWEATDKKPVRLNLVRQPLTLRPNYEDLSYRSEQEVITTFYIDAESSNAVFTPYRASDLYFPADSLFLDSSYGIRAPYYLDKSVVYTVVSKVDDPRSEFIAKFDKKAPKEMDRYLSLPDNFPKRVTDLAEEIAGDEPTPYLKAVAIDKYLKANYPYDLDIGPQTKEMDAVEYFLFEQKRGYCEMFASSMATMLRSQGVPARVVTGYRPGQLNPFSGAYEIRAIDAHAWVDVYVAGYGWVEFDPTSTFSVPKLETKYFVAGETFKYFRSKLAALPFVKELSELSQKNSTARGPLTMAVSLALILGVLIVIYLILRNRTDILARFRKKAPPDQYERMLNILARYGIRKQFWQTPSEFRSVAMRHTKLKEIDQLTNMYERTVFGQKPPQMTDAEIEQALKDLQKKLEELYPGTRNGKRSAAGKK